MPTNHPDIFQLEPSWLLVLLHILLLILAISSVLTISIPLIAKLSIGIVAVTFSAVIMVRDVFLQLPVSVKCIIHQNKQWKLQLQSGDFVAVTLRSSSVVTRYCCLLYFRNIANNAHYPCIIFVDSLSKKSFRRLRFLLKLDALARNH